MREWICKLFLILLSEEFINLLLGSTVNFIVFSCLLMAIKFYHTSSFISLHLLTVIPLDFQFIGDSDTSGKPHGNCSFEVCNALASKLLTAVTAVEQEPAGLPWNSTVMEGKGRDMEKMQSSLTSRLQDW